MIINKLKSVKHFCSIFVLWVLCYKTFVCVFFIYIIIDAAKDFILGVDRILFAVEQHHGS